MGMLNTTTATHDNTIWWHIPMHAQFKAIFCSQADICLGWHFVSFCQEGLWFWSDGSRFDFTTWSPGQPDNHGGQEHCVEMNTAGTVTTIQIIFLLQWKSWIPWNQLHIHNYIYTYKNSSHNHGMVIMVIMVSPPSVLHCITVPQCQLQPKMTYCFKINLFFLDPLLWNDDQCNKALPSVCAFQHVWNWRS